MMRTKLTKDLFALIIDSIRSNEKPNIDFLFEIYDVSFSAIEELIRDKEFSNAITINSVVLINYILGEYTYALEERNEKEKEEFISDEKNIIYMSSVVSDKYMSMAFFPSKDEILANKYLPPVSSLNTYLNFFCNVLSTTKKGDPTKTLMQDMLYKAFSIIRCILELLVEGFETEAMALWRTLHETECILILLNNNNDELKKTYLKHMHYAIEFKKGRSDENETDATFVQIKQEMHEHDLKSKDTKKFIEYGWLYDTKEYKENPNIKLNFRDGLQTLANLHEYSKIYEETSELIHSTPTLIYSSKLYYYLNALVNTYESFFRIEKVFDDIFAPSLDGFFAIRYENMKQIYYRQLVVIHKREKKRLESIAK